MPYRCSRCHHRFEVEVPQACPSCHAEAGLELERGIPAPMRLFGVFLGLVIAAAALGGMVSRIAG